MLLQVRAPKVMSITLVQWLQTRSRCSSENKVLQVLRRETFLKLIFYVKMYKVGIYFRKSKER